MVPFRLFHKSLFLPVALSAALAGFAFVPESAAAADETDRLAEAYNADGLTLFGQISGAAVGNIVLSPYGIGTALAMAYAGARDGTGDGMATGLGLEWSPETIGAVNARLAALVSQRTADENATIAVANALHLTKFGDRVAEAYKSLLTRDFGAEIFAGSSLDDINSWVRGKTDGKIDAILSELDPLSVAVLLNAIHFTAKWSSPFAAESTGPGDFRLTPGETVTVPMMHQTTEFRLVRTDAYDAIALPYKGNQLEMILVLPKTESAIGEIGLVLDAKAYAALTRQLAEAPPVEVRLTLPKFSFDFGADLIPPLAAMGIRLPFDAAHADFSGVTGSLSEADRIFITQIVHKALIDVNEEGTEAAAATAIEFGLTSAMPPQKTEDLTIDHPFLFAIADHASGALLFVGRVSDPRDAATLAAADDTKEAIDLMPLVKTAEMVDMASPMVAGAMLMPSPRRGGGAMPGEGDEFATFEDGRTLSVAKEPVSTFSVDVDTAAYSYVRRMLEEGGLPQADAVRVEEMINYFDYGYDGPDSLKTPFAIHTSLFPTPWHDGTELLRIGIQGYRVPAEDRPPANIVFLVDTSGSMDEADKLPLLKKSFELLLGQLGDTDTVSIVAYAGSAGVVLEPTAASDKIRIRAALNDLTPGGSTAGAEGIELAYQLAEQAHVATGTNRVILATDGDFNVGIDDPDALKRFIAKKRDSGISLSVLGFGSGNLDDATMQALAQNGNGTAAYIDSFSEARKVLTEEVGASLVSIARDVKVQVEFNPARVAEYRLIGYETRALNSEDFNNDAVDAGDIGSGHSVTALYEIVPVGSPAALNDPLRYGAAKPDAGDTGDEVAFIKLRYKPGDADTSELITVPVMAGDAAATLDAAPESARFATAVAAFGQKLRDNPALASWDYAAIKALANTSRGEDSNGYRAELVRLIDLASSLDS